MQSAKIDQKSMLMFFCGNCMKLLVVFLPMHILSSLTKSMFCDSKMLQILVFVQIPGVIWFDSLIALEIWVFSTDTNSLQIHHSSKNRDLYNLRTSGLLLSYRIACGTSCSNFRSTPNETDETAS